MKLTNIAVFTLSMCVSTVLSAQNLGKSVGLFDYPAQQQSAEQQGKDDYECYNWAQEQTAYDPMNPPEFQAAEVESGADGSRLRGAARGAARGAVIGEIADDDYKKGAQIGAAAGAMRGGAQSRQQKAAQAQANEQAAAQQEAAGLDNFKRAMSSCLTAKGYSVS